MAQKGCCRSAGRKMSQSDSVICTGPDLEDSLIFLAGTSTCSTLAEEPCGGVAKRIFDTSDLSWTPDFDSFGRHAIPVIDEGRFTLDHVLRPFARGSKAQIEILLDHAAGDMKILAKRFPCDYLQDDSASFHHSNPQSAEDPWTEIFLGLVLGKQRASREQDVVPVVPSFGVYRDLQDDVLLLMEWSPGGDLFEISSSLGAPGPEREETATQLLCALLEAVTRLHCKGIAHGNICAENAILRVVGAEVEVVLIDFAMAVHDTDLSATMGPRGSLMYRAPETVGDNAIYDARAADLFACGVVGYVLATGTYPWQSTAGDCKAFAYVQKNGPKKFFDKRTITMGTSKVPVSQVLSARLQSILAPLLDMNPAERRVLWH
ncbi:cdr1 [Symbiodinium natans]|uniref:Cdr1 protein n=1 Tax=Symbiodinium natans TaxID=878477 RepID=A0A812MW99_9DINO|nr:cdr1 [Symbiodinium natans]